jgi:hypothetical protein
VKFVRSFPGANVLCARLFLNLLPFAVILVAVGLYAISLFLPPLLEPGMACSIFFAQEN